MAGEGEGQGNTGAGDIPEIGVLLGDHSTNELFSDVKDVGSLATMIIDNSKTIAENNTALEELRANQPVVPESADDYAYEAGEKDIPLGDDDLTTLREFAHDKKWTANQFNEAVQIRNDLVNKAVDAHNVQIEEAQTALKKDMGDDYEPGVAMVKKVLATFGSEGLKDRADDLASDPDIFKLVHAFAKVVSPDVLEGRGAGDFSGSEKTTAQKLYG